MRCRRCWATALLTGVILPAQTGQYPPGQYPPGQYPPNTYPNTYPTRLPGGVPVNLPVPEIKLPKRKAKEKGKSEGELKIALASVEGALRSMGEKELILEAGPKKILRFRLLAKTRFQNKEGEPIRDSLLHSGDRISVQVNTDDEETALRVVLLRTATDRERAAAEKPVETSTVRAPRAEDLGKPRTVAVEQSAPEQFETGAAPAPAWENAPGPGSPAAAPAPATGASDEQIIRQARSAAESYSGTLPDFLVQQVTSRYFSTGFPAKWQSIDEVTAEVSYVNGKEDYRSIAVDGKPVSGGVERTGSWSAGEFATMLQDVLSPATNAAFKRRGEDRIAGRAALIYDFTVEEDRSHWVLVSPDGRRHTPAYQGAIWVDKATCRVLRIEQRTESIPKDFPFSRAEWVLQYAFARIDEKIFLMPAGGENLACMSGSGACTRNVIAYRNYRKFNVDSAVKY